MKLLLDTHALVWFYQTDDKMSTLACELIEDPRNETLVSPASYWEVAIKMALQKPLFGVSYSTFIQEAIIDNGFSILHIEPRHCEEILKLPFHHKDPFDRLLIAQAKAENMTLLSADTIMDSYAVNRIW